MKHFDCLIVGAGHAGAQAAIALRQQHFAGSIGLLGDEAFAPYDRPSLSKEYLAGQKSFERMQIRPSAFWDERQITLYLATHVEEVDAGARQLRSRDGSRFSFAKLIWAAGGTPRRLNCSGSGLGGIHYIRNRHDCDALMQALPAAQTVAIIGGGFIGLEAAAVLRSLGKQVILLEAQERLLARVAAPELSSFFARSHRDQGVDVRLGVGVKALHGCEGQIAAIETAAGERIQAQLLIVGIGIEPNIAPLLAAGADADQGVLVDDYCRTSLEDVYCIGDCAQLRNGVGVRIESVQNAVDQAKTVGNALSGSPAPYSAIPWFWSNQYDIRLQTIGLNIGYDATLLRGTPDSGSFSLGYLRDGVLIAVDSINATRDYTHARKLIAASAVIDSTLFCDPDVPLLHLLER